MGGSVHRSRTVALLVDLGCRLTYSGRDGTKLGVAVRAFDYVNAVADIALLPNLALCACQNANLAHLSH